MPPQLRHFSLPHAPRDFNGHLSSHRSACCADHVAGNLALILALKAVAAVEVLILQEPKAL
jgi:hypothetical protein